MVDIPKFIYAYHYTSWHNWKLIKDWGLIPQMIYEENINSPGIWVWKKKLPTHIERGWSIMVMNKENCTNVVALRLKINKDDLKRDRSGLLIELEHKFTINHSDNTQLCTALIVKRPIPACNIKLVNKIRYVKTI